MLTQSKIQQSYQSLMNGRQLSPLDKKKILSKWKIRFQYIGCQAYCCHCKKWDRDASYDYCHQCGSDYYSHIDVQDGQIVPIRRGWCFTCKINLSLNQQFDCEACYYRKINNQGKAQQINLLRLKVKEELKNSDISKQIERIKSVQKIMYQIIIVGNADYDFSSQQAKKNLMNQITEEMINWGNYPDKPKELKEKLWKQFHNQAKQLYNDNGICF